MNTAVKVVCGFIFALSLFFLMIGFAGAWRGVQSGNARLFAAGALFCACGCLTGYIVAVIYNGAQRKRS